jgi:hypothetical protein
MRGWLYDIPYPAGVTRRAVYKERNKGEEAIIPTIKE